VNGKLFIAMQRLCNWLPSQDAYIAVFDTNTNNEINTGMGANGLKGIRLDVRNPFGKIKYYNGRIYIAGADGTLFGANNPIQGGIQSVDITTYAKSSVIAPTTQITALEIISDTKGYFVKYNAWGNNSIVSFNPSTWAISNVNIAGIGNSNDRNINDITKDKDNMLWVSDASLIKPGIYIVDTSTDTIQEGPISTDLNPSEITFCERDNLL
ncbi:MAG: hypothetical protein NTY22_08985, partial [Proteobacteria bacterium]|nr:hypothetical protein [Pseudomonadota bacterium]